MDHAIEPQYTPPAEAEEQKNAGMKVVEIAAEKIRRELSKVIVGQSQLIELLTVAMLCDGHVLLEGPPGIAKTLTARLLAKTVAADFSRIQFTPDLMPTDVLGTMVFQSQTATFRFHPGPIFANMVLIDEINRAPAKTQSALFEVMEEKQVTIDGSTYPMGFPFLVMATQNPIEQEGTYKLPEAQLDRFIFKIIIGYPTLEEEQLILQRFKNDFRQTMKAEVEPVITAAELRACQDAVEQVYIKDEILNYIAAIVHNTRHNGDLFLGASPRASLAIMKTSKAVAAINGRDFVIPEDVQDVVFPVLNHRMILTPEREMDGSSTKEVIEEIIKKTEAPR